MALNALLYYDAIAGTSSTGGIDEFGNHRFFQRFTDTPGWTHIVATQDHLLYYNRETTAIAIAQIDVRGNHQVLQHYSANASWTTIATTEDHVLFYNGNTGDAEVGAIDPLGNYRSLQTYTDLTLGWTHIAATQNRLLYYNATTTELATAQIDPDGNHQFIHRYPPGSTSVWTHLLSTQNHFLFYNVNEGGGFVSRVDESGNYLPLQSSPNLSTNWTQVAGTQKHVLYYSASLGGVAATGDIDEQGVFRDISFYDNFPQGLTHIVAPKIATLPNAPDVLLDPIVELLRPDDLLNLRIECRNLQLNKSDSTTEQRPTLVPTDATQTAYLIVQFPPQTIAEEAIFEPDPPPAQPPQDERNKPYNKTPPGFPLSQMPTKARARIGKPSRLVFQLPAHSNPQIPYTTEGLLNWTGLELSVSPIANTPQSLTAEERVNVPAIAPPSETETAIELPFRLILSPNSNVIWTNALNPKTHAGRTELWHTRLAYRNGETIANFSKANPAPLRAIWSSDYVAQPSRTVPGDLPSNSPWKRLGQPDIWTGEEVLTAINPRDRHELVILTSAWNGFIIGKDDERTYTPQPIHAEQMILSPLGGWLKSRGHWKPPVEVIFRGLNPILLPPEGNPRIEPDEPPLETLMRLLDPTLRVQVGDSPEERFHQRAPLKNLRLPRYLFAGEPLNISEWVHVATQGRDHYVRIVYEGYLYPFGHRAALIKVTERKFRNIDGTPFAYLAQRMFIVVREPVKDYTQYRDQFTEPPLNQGRVMPLKQVRLTTLVTPDIDLPKKTPPNDPQISPIIQNTDYCFWVKVNQQDFKFHAVGQDSGGHNIDFTVALIFVPNSEVGKVGQVKINYDSNATRKICQVPGQAVTYAEPNAEASDNTTLTTQSLFFSTSPASAPGGFLPKLEKAAVNLAAVEQLLGKTLPTEIEYYKDYLENGFDPGNEVFAKLLNKVPSDFAAEQAGGMATPNLSINGVTRKSGAIAGDLTQAAKNTFNPKDFFKDVENAATLFGKLKLTELISPGTFNNAPTIQFFPQSTPPSVHLNWRPSVVEELSVGLFKFKRETGSVLVIEGLVEQPNNGNPGRSSFSGELTNFHLEFFNIVKLSFDAFRFRAETKRKTEVNVQLKGEDALEFLGDLKFVNKLKEIIPPGLFGDGPSLEITPQPAIRAGFAIGLPPVEVGVFALKDVALGAALTLPFLDGSPLFEFNISERHRPFNLTIAFFGGGGFFRLQLDTLAVRVIEAAFEFGASASVNLGVASGGVYIMAGIYFKLETKPDGTKKATLEGYFRMGGNLTILGFISVSLEFNLSFTYEAVGKATGRATLTVKVKVLFISKSISITVEKTFGGGKGDPIFAQVWDAPEIWNEYVGAFA
jgi:hypothetical protein